MKHTKGVSDNQLELLKFVTYSENLGALADMDQVLEKMSWAPTKESIQFTIRAMIAKGLIEKSGLQSRRGRNRVCFKTSSKGRQILDPRKLLSDVVDFRSESFVPGLADFDLGLDMDLDL